MKLKFNFLFVELCKSFDIIVGIENTRTQVGRDEERPFSVVLKTCGLKKNNVLLHKV